MKTLSPTKRALATLTVLAGLLAALMIFDPTTVQAGPSTWTNGTFGGGGGFPDGGTTGTGAANEITYWASPSTLTGTPKFNYNNTSKKMGLGTTAPTFMLEAVQEDGDPTLARIFASHYGTGGPAYMGVVRGRGTHAAPQPVAGGDLLGYFIFGGQQNTTPGSINGSALLLATAAENFNPSARGATLDIYTTAIGSSISAPAFTIDAHRNSQADYDLIANQLFGITRTRDNQTSFGPNTPTLISSFLMPSCSISDCQWTLPEIDDVGDPIRDGDFMNILCAPTSTGTCSFPNVAGQQQNTTGGTVTLIPGKGTLTYLYSSDAAPGGAWIQYTPSTGDPAITSVVYVAKTGVDDTASFRGTADYPYLTVQYAVTKRAPAPTTQAEFLTPVVFNIAPGTYTENVTIHSRVSAYFVGYRASLVGSITWSLDNTEKFGSSASAMLGIIGAASNGASSVNGFVVGDGNDSVLVSNNVTTPLTSPRMVFMRTSFSGRVLDVNANSGTSSIVNATQAGFSCATTCNSDVNVNLPQWSWTGLSNSYGTVGTTVRRIQQEFDSVINGPITTTVTSSFNETFVGCYFAASVTFSGPAGSFKVDGASNYQFVLGAGALAGGATKVITENLDGVATPIYTTSTLQCDGNATMTLDLAVNGGDITSSATTFNLLNATVTTLNIGGASATTSIGASTSSLLAKGAVVEIDGVVTAAPTCAADGDVGRLTRYSKSAGATISICLCTKLANVYTNTALGTGDCT